MSASDGHRPAWVLPLLLAGVLSFASSSILIRFAEAAPSLVVAAVRTMWAVLFLAPMGVPATRRAWSSLGVRDRWLVLAAGLLLGVHFVAWISSVYLTTVASAAVLVSTGPVFLAFLGFVVLRERLEARTAVAIVVAVLGSALIAWSDARGDAAPGRNPLVGNALALLAAVVWAAYLLIGRVVRQRLDWLAYVFPIYAIAGLTAFVAVTVQGLPLGGYPWQIYALCAVMALLPQILGHGSFNYAIKFYPAAMLGLLGLLEPVGASLMAYALFDERPGTIALLGMTAILAAVASTVLRPSRAAEAPVTD